MTTDCLEDKQAPPPWKTLENHTSQAVSQATEVGGRASVVFYQKPQQIVGYSIAKEILLSITDGLGVVRDHH